MIEQSVRLATRRSKMSFFIKNSVTLRPLCITAKNIANMLILALPSLRMPGIEKYLRNVQ